MAAKEEQKNPIQVIERMTRLLLIEISAFHAFHTVSSTFGRPMTATASQGLALMIEVVYIASSLRAPIVMAVGNRALSGPINIHFDVGNHYQASPGIQKCRASWEPACAIIPAASPYPGVDFPATNLLLHLYHPFETEVTAAVLRNLEASLARTPLNVTKPESVSVTSSGRAGTPCRTRSSGALPGTICRRGSAPDACAVVENLHLPARAGGRASQRLQQAPAGRSGPPASAHRPPPPVAVTRPAGAGWGGSCAWSG
mgnify:CR=1 FL=1